MKQFIDFINNSYTAFHAIKLIEEKLLKEGFEKLDEQNRWSLEKNKSYYVIKNSSSIIAFKTNNITINTGFNIVASHSDSPSFKVKPNGLIVDQRNSYAKLNTEAYGGMITQTWMDRPLGIAGRVFTNTTNGVLEHLVNFDETIIIPNVAIHLTRTIEAKQNLQLDLLPLIGDENSSFNDTIKKYVNEEEVLSTDLFLYNKEEAFFSGFNKEYISSSKLDDLECAYASIVSLIKATPKAINVCAIFNNEEVGSRSNNGAASTFLKDTLKRIASSFNMDFDCCLAKSFIVSSDNAHALHPNHPELSDPTNQVYMNKGIVIKHQAGLSYTTDGYSEAVFKKICKMAGILYQDYTNRSDQRGGSTLGAISLSQVSIPSVDIGLAQLAMHSTIETAGVKDLEFLIQVLQKYFEVTFEKEDNLVKII